MLGSPVNIRDVEEINKDQQCVHARRIGLNFVIPYVEHYMQLGQRLSEHQHILCAFAEETLAWWYYDGHLKLIDLTPKLIQILFSTAEQRALDPHGVEIAQLNEILPLNGQTIQSASMMNIDVKLHHIRPAKTLLFSCQPHQISDDIWQSMCQLRQDHVELYELRYQNQLYLEQVEEQEALNFAKTKFLSIIAHDLRAPFHGLLGFSEVLAKERQDLEEDSIQRISDYLHDTAQSTYDLLENLLNWAMSENGRFNCHPIQFKLRDITQIVMQVLNAVAMKKQIHLSQDIAEDVKVYADMHMLTSVIQNLVSNALKFSHMGRNARVHISASSQDGLTYIEVHDHGLGMTKRQIDELFQAHTVVSIKGTAGERGTGLGLVLCKRFIDLNLGQITVQSTEGEGTTFRVELASTPERWQQRAEELKV